MLNKRGQELTRGFLASAIIIFIVIVLALVFYLKIKTGADLSTVSITDKLTQWWK